jgi:hypothetical protein
MKASQYEVIGNLISRKRGATPAELIERTWSTCVHKRMSEMRSRGWRIWREQVPGKSYGRYFGQAPQGV